ncbi:MAG: hypothetical protein WC006_06065 [Bacilli bacterium]|nr:hypothetical protein [Bacilli bacterium]
MKLRTKNLLSVALIIMLIAITGLTYAYWDGLSNDAGSTIEIGVGSKITVEEKVYSEDGNLIPVGAILGTNEIEQVVKEYDVVLSKTSKEPLYLNVTVSNIQIGNKEYDGLVNVDVDYNPTISAQEKVILTITMNNLNIDYSDIYGKEITYSVEFSVMNNNE